MITTDLIFMNLKYMKNRIGIKQYLKDIKFDVNVKPQPKLQNNDFQNLKNAGEVILSLVSIAGLATLAVVAPNAVKMIYDFKKLGNAYKRASPKKIEYDLTKAFYYLKKKSYVEIFKSQGDIYFKITAKGRKKIRQINFRNLKIPKTFWDKRWWFVMADIPTKEYKNQADQFRKKIKELMFYPLQRTVWAYPYDPRDEIDFISAHYGLERFVTVLKAEVVDESDSQDLTAYFKKNKLI